MMHYKLVGPRAPSTSLTPLASLGPADGVVSVMGVVTATYSTTPTNGADLKSALQLSDTSLQPTSSVRVNCFLPLASDHPHGCRLGDIMKATRLRVSPYRGKMELMLTKESTFVVNDGEHSNAPLLGLGPDEIDAVDKLREWRLTLLSGGILKAVSGPHIAMRFPALADGLQPPPPAQQLAALSTAAVVPVAATAAPMSLAARHALLHQQQRKQLGALTKPVAGNKGYICDLALVQISGLSDPHGNGKKLNMRLWDNTRAAVAATCWDSSKCALVQDRVKAGGGAAYAQLSNVRVACSKVHDTEMEIHINENSALDFAPDNDPRISPLQLAAAAGAGTTVVSTSGETVSSSHLLVPAVAAPSGGTGRPQPVVLTLSPPSCKWPLTVPRRPERPEVEMLRMRLHEL